MKAPKAPVIDARRKREFAEELRERARVWMPTWAFDDVEGDFGGALLEIAARFDSEVAERLDQAGEKMRRGFLDWLGMQGEAARPARMPVVFKLADTARQAVFAAPPVRMQVEAGGASLMFETETETDLRLVPGRIDMVVGVDADKDAIYLPPPGLSDLKPLEPLPVEWKLKSFASAGTLKFQLEPDAGLSRGMTIQAGGRHYRIEEADNGIVTVDTPLEADLEVRSAVSKVGIFAPFDGVTRNRQEHALYIGDDDLLNIEAAAVIEVTGARVLNTGVKWQYWGKTALKEDEPGWRDLTIAGIQNAEGLLLEKAEGALDPRKIGEVTSRWVRAISVNVDRPPVLFEADSLRLKVNCDPNLTCPKSGSVQKGVAVEAMTNNTPLVLNRPFFPLGQVPQQFDSFYLGSKEAFSKIGATAKVCLEMSNPTCHAYTPVPDGFFALQGTIAGVGEDGALYLFKVHPFTGTIARFRGPLRPPLPQAVPATRPAPPDAAVELNPRCLPVIWIDGNDFFAAVAAKGDIWIWHEIAADEKKSGWTYHSRVPDSPENKPAQIESILILNSRPRQQPGVVLSKGRIWVFNDKEWSRPATKSSPDDGELREFAVIAPILDPAFNVTDSIVGVDTSNQELYSLSISIEPDPAKKSTVEEKAILLPAGTKLDAGNEFEDNIPVGGIQPAAVQDPSSLQIVALEKGRNSLLAVKIVFSKPPSHSFQRVPLETGVTALGAKVSLWDVAGQRQYSVSAIKSLDNLLLATLVPTFDSKDEILGVSTITGAFGTVGSPVKVVKNIVVPGGSGNAFVATMIRLSFRGPKAKLVREAVKLPNEPFHVKDYISALNQNGNRVQWEVKKAATVRGADALYLVDSPVGSPPLAQDPKLMGYSGNGKDGALVDSTSFKLKITDTPVLKKPTLLRIEVAGQGVAFRKVKKFDKATGIVTIMTPVPGNPNDLLKYWVPKSYTGAIVPAIEFDPANDGNWDMSILDTAAFYFDSVFIPSTQKGSPFGIDGIHPTIVILGNRWTSTTTPTNQLTEFAIDGGIGPWRQELADASPPRPSLSWEYWNGKGWWSLEIEDTTARLLNTGSVTFKVPDDIAESDWAGKTNFWIRARLISGDYGKETVRSITRPVSDAKDPREVEQTIERLTDKVKAPIVLGLTTLYSICAELLPKYVLAKDNETIVDQSDANRTSGAIVEAFVSVGKALGRLSGKGGSAAEPQEKSQEDDCGPCPDLVDMPKSGEAAPEADVTADHDCPPECGCKNCPGSEVDAAGAETGTAGAGSKDETGRSLFLGLDAKVSAGTVNILLMVDKEAPHLDFAPMRIESLVGGQFKPLVVDDATRALGESGVLVLSFAVAPTLGNLFGKTLIWLRLTPKVPGERWAPSIRGAYLNAVYASSKETLTRELLGSSDGSPGLTLSLARPPVLRDTLELRVLEPLGEEDREEFASAGSGSVLSDVKGLPGDWVLWTKVTDTGDEAPDSRVYMLDETTGEVRFGDGKHGRIPPVGRNNIVAFGYSRTEPGKPDSDAFPANSVEARTSLNLVSPVESVESVIAADQAAGGSPPETDASVLRYGFSRFRHRRRAVTIRDLEDLALESSPDIVQARVVPGSAGIRLIVIMRGKTPAPGAAQARELHRLLLDASPVSMSAPQALRIEGPGIRKLRIELTLEVERLEHASRISNWVNAGIARFFDTGFGGADGSGWPLGLRASEDDIAYVLSDAPLIRSIRYIKCLESLPGGRELEGPISPKPTEIVMLDDDPVLIRFETAEVEV